MVLPNSRHAIATRILNFGCKSRVFLKRESGLG